MIFAFLSQEFDLQFVNTLNQWCRRRGCKRPRKVLICRKSGKNP